MGVRLIWIDSLYGTKKSFSKEKSSDWTKGAGWTLKEFDTAGGMKVPRLDNTICFYADRGNWLAEYVFDDRMNEKKKTFLQRAAQKRKIIMLGG